MQIERLLAIGSIAALAVASPALAKNSNVTKNSEAQTSPSCQASQRAADGSWTVIPCQELSSSGQTQHKSAPGTGEEQH